MAKLQTLTMNLYRFVVNHQVCRWLQVCFRRLFLRLFTADSAASAIYREHHQYCTLVVLLGGICAEHVCTFHSRLKIESFHDIIIMIKKLIQS